ncbi:SDR family NAD(P)-dependent oxidoreductase [Thalassococcus sp. S3]|uniref:SDR family NAD(P)-dependent oxidoreductase n=1 Tax=Thalassococcus sp. S3 TaxID=2017482 RepID=UPI0010240FFC|nr:SDR family NAD(P)-dependent oxidoreductase [Thalassococcus sp. S3]QBF30802.1 3-oxoacyl-ACP reductase [Thalassococcus sp. S3]
MIDLNGKTFVITGAASGIGLATAKLMLGLGANVGLLDRGAPTLEDDQAHAERALSVTCDVSDPDTITRAMAAVADRFGPLSGLICSAGIYRDHPFQEMSFEDWRTTQSVNLDGVFLTVKAALPHLLEGASIVNLTSMAAHMGASLNHAHYGASKGGVLALTRSLARELGPKIRVNAVSPGVIETPMTAGLLAARGDEALYTTPLARFGTSQEVARAIAFLASDAASFVTGEVIHVNGGIYMAG